MRQTHTVALLALPKAAWDFVAKAMEDAGYDHSITESDDGLTVMFDMGGIAVIPERGDDSDSFINSGRLSDLMVATGEDAFRAGFAAGMDYGADYGDCAGSYYEAWGRYDVPDAIHELQANL